MTTRTTRREIITFLVLTFSLSAPFYFLISTNPEGLTVTYVLPLMWSPGIAALITRFAYHRTLGGLGWRWGKTRYQLSAYFLPLIYGGIVYGAIWLTGLGGFDSSAYSPPEVLLMLTVLPLLSSAITALGEEIGWRGFLVPQLAKLTSFTKTSLISGVIWAVWHYPLIIFSNYRSLGGSGSSDIPLWFALACFTVMVIAISFVFNWFRIKSGSVWTAVFLHTTHNSFIQSLYADSTINKDITPWVAGEFGIGLALVTSVVAFVFWTKRNTLSSDQEDTTVGTSTRGKPLKV